MKPWSGSDTGSFAADKNSIRRDEHGVPTAFRVFRVGSNPLTINGTSHDLVLTAEDLLKIVEFQKTKGENVPIDAEHFLQQVADSLGMTESDLLVRAPVLGEKAVNAYASLTSENGELWAHVSRWADSARKLLSSAGDRLAGYFSPTIRGLKDGNLRITSIALTSVPALNNLDLLAAADGSIGKGEIPMKMKIQTLCKLLGLDSVALAADGADLAPLLDKAIVALTDAARGVADVAEFRKQVKDALALSDGDSLSVAAGKILSLAAKTAADTQALSDLSTRLQKLDAEQKARMIADLKGQGKLTEDMATKWAAGQDMAALAEWAKHAPVIVQPERQTNPADASQEDTLAMSEQDIAVAKACGLDPAKVAKANHLRM